MSTNAYAFVSRWRVAGRCDEVFAVLEDAEGLTRWWGSVYLDVRELEGGDASGVGRLIQLHTRGWLPYTLTWRLRVTDADAPHGFGFTAEGDFVGTGRWQFVQDGAHVNIRFVWRVIANKPLLRRLSWLLKPLFAANHHWAMAQGERGLAAEIARRAALHP